MSSARHDDGDTALAETLDEDAYPLRKRILVPAGGMNGRVPDDLPACQTCVDVVYIDRRGEERSERAELARDFTDRKGLKECRECSKLCLPVLYEDYEGGHTKHTCFLCDLRGQVEDEMREDPPVGLSKAETAVWRARRQDSYYRAVSPVSAVRKVWS